MNGKVVDLLCMIPLYDKEFINGINKKEKDIELVSISFHLNKDFFNQNNVNLDKSIIDIVSRLNINNGFLRKSLKFLEYIFNLLILSIRSYFNRPQFIHFQWLPLYPYSNIEIYFLKYLKRINIKLLYTVHNILPHDTGNKYKRKYVECYSLFDGLICHTEEAKHELLNDFGIGEKKIAIIPHGIFSFNENTEKSCNELKELNIKCKKVLFLGSIRPYKGIEFLLNSWNLVVKSEKNVKLFLVGHGDHIYINEIKKMIVNLDLSESVIFVERYISNNEVRLFHEMADILVYPYQNITQSGAILTGATFGKPIIATNIGGFKEVIQHRETGILVQYNDIELFAKEILGLLNNTDMCKKYGDRIKDFVEKRYSWDKISDKTIKFYKEILKVNN